MKKFWNWTIHARTVKDDAGMNTTEFERELHLNGAIAEESWYDDDVTPQIFREDLQAGTGPITVWINSPGGDVFAAAQIYNMLKEYSRSSGKVTVKIDGLAASAASVIAMAGDTVLMSPVAMMMIHDPSTVAWGNAEDIKQTLQMLDEVKESIINAYVTKSNLSRREIGNLMSSEYWMNATEAKNKGFVDDILYRDDDDALDIAMAMTAPPAMSMGFSEVVLMNSIKDRMVEQSHIDPPTQEPADDAVSGRKVVDLLAELEAKKDI